VAKTQSLIDVADALAVNSTRQVRRWRRFKGHLNTEEVLVDKARTLTPVLCKSVHRESELLLQRLRKQDKCVVHAQLWPIFLELTFFLVHYVHRLSVLLLGTERKSIFLDSLMSELADFLASVHADEDDSQRFRKLFPDWCTERQMECGVYKRLLPESDDAPEKTLFWEFERKIAGNLGFRDEASVMLLIDEAVMNLIEVLNLGELTADATDGVPNEIVPRSYVS
jgi:hypothetical protein